MPVCMAKTPVFPYLMDQTKAGDVPPGDLRSRCGMLMSSAGAGFVVVLTGAHYGQCLVCRRNPAADNIDVNNGRSNHGIILIWRFFMKFSQWA